MTRVESLTGIHDVSVDAYHRDEHAPEPSLSHSGIVTLLNETPAHFKARNPRLTDFPDYIETPTNEQDLGSLIHALILGKGAAFEVHEVDDWRGKRGDLRDASRAAGRIPVKRRNYDRAMQIAEHAISQFRERFGGWPIGESEVAMFWKRPTAHGEIWCRALMDHFSERTCTILDVKTTSRCINDEDLRRQIASTGADIQAAWYLEGASTLFPQHAGLWQFIFLYIEVEPPFQPRPIKLSESWLTRARFRIDRAANTFADCLRRNQWPGWPTDQTALSAPSWLESCWEEEELAGATA